MEVLRQALKSKSRWWRKCPIQVKSTGRPLLHGEPSFALFAEGSAAKEQWYLALKQATGGLSRQAVEDAYRQFCQRVRESGGLYPKVKHITLRMRGFRFDTLPLLILKSASPARYK